MLKWVDSFLLPVVGQDCAHWPLTPRNENSCLRNTCRTWWLSPKQLICLQSLTRRFRVWAPSFWWSETTFLCFAIERERNQQQFIFLHLLSHTVMALLLLTMVACHSEQCGGVTVWWKSSWSVMMLWIWWCNGFSVVTRPGQDVVD